MVPLLLALLLSPEKPIVVPALAPSGAVTPYDEPQILDVATNGDLSLVVWQDLRSDLSQDVFAARITSSGEVLDPAGILIATAETYDVAPRAAWNGSRFVVTWLRRDVLTRVPDETRIAEIDVNGRVLDVDGTRFSANRVVDLAANGATLVAITKTDDTPSYRAGNVDLGNVREPVIIATDDGFVAAWIRQTGTQQACAVEMLRLDTAGQAIGESRPIPQLDGGSGVCSLALASRGGEILVAFAAGPMLRTVRIAADDSTQNHLDIHEPTHHAVLDVVAHADRYDVLAASDGRLTIYNEMPQILLPGPQVLTARGVAVNGRTLATWITYPNVFARFLDEDEANLVSRTAPNQQLPALASDGASVLAVWEEHRGLSEIATMGRRLARDGTPSGEPFTIGSAPSNYLDTAPPAVLFDGQSYLVVWQEQRFLSEELYQHLVARRISREGVLGEPFVLSSMANVNSAPAVASDGTNTLVVWSNGSYAAPMMRAALIGSSSIALPASKNAGVVWNGASYLAVGESNQAIRVMGIDRNGALTFSADQGQSGDAMPSLAWNGSAHLLVFQRLGAIYGMFLDRSGARIGTDFPIFTEGTSWHPRVVASGRSFLVSWERGGRYRDVLATRVSSDGAIEEPFAISASPSNDAAPALLSLDAAHTLVAYQRLATEITASHRVFTRVLQPAPKRRAVR